MAGHPFSMAGGPLHDGGEDEDAAGSQGMDSGEALHALCQEHGIAAVYLMDPAAGRPSGAPDGPDLGVVFEAKVSPGARPGVWPAVVEALRRLFGTNALVPADLEALGPAQQYRAIRGRLLYAAGEDRRLAFEDGVLRDALDFAFEMRLFDEERAEELTRETRLGEP